MKFTYRTIIVSSKEFTKFVANHSHEYLVKPLSRDDYEAFIDPTSHKLSEWMRRDGYTETTLEVVLVGIDSFDNPHGATIKTIDSMEDMKFDIGDDIVVTDNFVDFMTAEVY